MISILIYCHNREEATFFSKLCSYSVAVMGDDSLHSFILNKESYRQKDIHNIYSPDVIIAEITDARDVKGLCNIRRYFRDAVTLILVNEKVSPEFYVNSEISPTMLLLKPYTVLKAQQIVQKTIYQYYKNREDKNKIKSLFCIYSKREAWYYAYTDICYFEARDKKIVLHSNGKEVFFYNSLRELEQVLPEYFIRCHRSYIVNFIFIQKVDFVHNLFYLRENPVIPISQKYKAKLIAILQKYEDFSGDFG